MKSTIRYHRSQPSRFLILLSFLGLSLASMSQKMTSATVLTPICPGGTGTVRLAFTGVTYPFNIVWYGSNIEYGKVTITGSPQTITMKGDVYGGSSTGTSATFYTDDFQTHFGTFPLGINFDPFNAGVSATCTAGATFAVNNIAGGTAPYSLILYNKSSGSTITSGSSPLNVAFSTICPLSGNIGLKVQDATGCYATIDSLYIMCKGLIVQTSATMASCTNGTAQVTSVSGGVAPYTYLWNNGASSSSLSGLSRGSYYCVVTDATGCSGLGNAYVAQNPVINVNFTNSPATCNNSDGKAMAFATGGTAPYTYLWDNGSTIQSVVNLPLGTHKVSITDNKGCTADGYTYIASNSPVFVTFSTTASSCTGTTGTATLTVTGGQTPYSYVWDGLSFTSASATGLAVGQYSFMVTDFNGCQRRGVVTIPPISQITANISGQNIVCPGTLGTVQVSASSPAGSLTYLWNNGATTNSITNVATGSYSVKITDANKCSVTKSHYLAVTSNIKLGFSSSSASCIFTSDGSVSVRATGGTAPYSYRWSTGQTTATISGLATGHYWVLVTDALGCRYDKGYDFVKVGYNASNNSCYCTIEGVVYNDLNSNCTKDAGEDGISDVLMKGGTLGYTSTDNNGYYSFKAPIGSYTIEETIDKGVSLSSCQSNNIGVSVTSVGGGCTKTVNFSNQLATAHDIVICIIRNNEPRPGNNFYKTLLIKNKGNVTESNIQTSLQNDGQLQWLNSSKAPFVSGGTNFYNLNPALTLKKGESQTYELDYYAPTNIPLGTQVYFRDSAAYTAPISTYWLTNEESPWNNINDFYANVVNSYDPNSKSVYPQGAGAEGKILLTTKDFKYVVHFENNGTATAQKIVITDTLDADLDVESFRNLSSSHGVETRINNGIVTFTFNNINLDFTPLGVYKASAQGYVAYTIKAKNTVILGTKLESRADIYFDYNAPIPTNKPINIYSKETGSVNYPIAFSNQILAFPNPTTGILNLQLPASYKGFQKVEIFNLQGQLMKTVQMEGEILTLDVSILTKGLYVVKVKSENGESGHIKFFIK